MFNFKIVSIYQAKNPIKKFLHKKVFIEALTLSEQYQSYAPF